MNCVSCNHTLQEGGNYCGQCGHKVGLPKAGKLAEIRAYAKEVGEEGKVVLSEIGETTKKSLKSDVGKSMVAWGAAGAVAGAILPFVGPAVIGALGAGYGALKKL